MCMDHRMKSIRATLNLKIPLNLPNRQYVVFDRTHKIFFQCKICKFDTGPLGISGSGLIEAKRASNIVFYITKH